MDHWLNSLIVAATLLTTTALAVAQPVVAPAPPFAIPNPHYITIELEVEVNRPAKDVWGRVGDFCAIAQWLRASCTIISGTESQLGAIRRVSIGGRPGGAIEIMVAKTALS